VRLGRALPTLLGLKSIQIRIPHQNRVYGCRLSGVRSHSCRQGELPSRRPVLAAVWIAALLTAGPTAQTFHRGIRGAVRDARGMLPGVSIALVNEATGASRSSETNAAGEYAFTNVVPGTYSLLTSLPGYRTFESRGLVIGTHQFLIVDIQLELGTVPEEVIVTVRPPVFDRPAARAAACDRRSGRLHRQPERATRYRRHHRFSHQPEPA
jgi:hypothetical protein